MPCTMLENEMIGGRGGGGGRLHFSKKVGVDLGLLLPQVCMCSCWTSRLLAVLDMFPLLAVLDSYMFPLLAVLDSYMFPLLPAHSARGETGTTTIPIPLTLDTSKVTAICCSYIMLLPSLVELPLHVFKNLASIMGNGQTL